ncbi:zf-UBP-domain-containing protein, partial [Rhodotorula sp. JG-1b]
PRPPETSGSTDLYWGTIHLYREAGAGESTRDEKRKARDEDDGRTVGLISVPGVLNAAALLSFIAPALEEVEQVRMLRDSTPNRSLVLVRFRNAPSASEFRRMYNGKPYHDSKDSEVCHVVPISSIKLKSTTTPPFTYPFSSSASDSPLPGTDPVELPTCPVCLELLDSRVTGLVQIMCQHNYHCQCLLKWGDSRCPVCRSTNARQRRNTITSETSESKCSTCQSPSNLWICVICGNVGCGRYQGGHAHSHFTETGHSFSLEIETGRIWSYLDDEYVHRLIRVRGSSVSGGGAGGDRLIELPSRAGRPSPGMTSIANSYGGPDRDAETEQDKLEALALEYGTLMTSQLSSQREWFEEEVDKLRKEVKELKGERKRLGEEWHADKKRLEDKLDAMKKEAQHEADERRKERAEASRVRKALEADLASERAVTASLSANLGALRLEFRNEQEATQAVRAEVDELKDQLNDLMAALSMRDRIEQEGPESEWAGASV